MSNIIIVGFITEGPTDVRFLESVIKRTFEDVALECESFIDIHSIENIKIESNGFNDMVVESAKKADKLGVMVLCVHTDADDQNDSHVFEHKIIPAFDMANLSDGTSCKNLVPVVPVCMTEAWMLADIDLLISEIGTVKSAQDLGLNRLPETIADPKSLIINALRIALEDNTRRRRRDILIRDLYQPIGQKITISALEKLPSYLKFKNHVREAYKKLNYLY